jgi:hypothetical protein
MQMIHLQIIPRNLQVMEVLLSAVCRRNRLPGGLSGMVRSIAVERHGSVLIILRY